MNTGPHLNALEGWTVAGRHGPLGRVVLHDDERRDESDVLLVRGGTTKVLYYHVPVGLVARVATGRQVLHIDADIDDFTPHLRPDGSVDLFPADPFPTSH